MKVGDLVELSSYAKKLKMMRSYIGDVGIVRKVIGLKLFPHHEEYRIIWSKSGDASGDIYFSRKDLKYAKKRNTIR
jgi:hypothetical protein